MVYYRLSQAKFPIKRFNKLLHLTVGEVTFAKTHYSSVLMSTLWSAPYLLVISKDDITLVNYIVKEAHTLMLPDNLGKSLHLPHHLTMNRVLSSDLCPTFISELRVVVSKYIGNCFHCNKVAARGGTFRPYHHFLTDPWVSVKMKRFDATCTFFSKISIDNINVRVKRSKTRASDWVNLALVFGVDCSTGYFFCCPCNDLSAKSLISALSVLFIKYSQPSEIVTDAHASFRSIATNNPWPSCNIRPRQPNEQHANFVESSIRVF